MAAKVLPTSTNATNRGSVQAVENNNNRATNKSGRVTGMMGSQASRYQILQNDMDEDETVEIQSDKAEADRIVEVQERQIDREGDLCCR